MIIPKNGDDPKMMSRLQWRVRWVLILILAGLLLVNHRWIISLIKRYFDNH